MRHHAHVEAEKRRNEIADLFKSGKTLKEIAVQYQISAARVRSIIKRVKASKASRETLEKWKKMGLA